MAVEFHGFSPSYKPNFVLCSVTSTNMQHSGHEVSPGYKKSVVVLRSSTVMENPKARKAIDAFVKFDGNQKGATLRLTRCLSESVDGIVVPEDVVRNTLAKHRFNVDDADSFVKLLHMKKIRRSRRVIANSC